ncbi:MAG: GNAT family N-acetyltransferase [Chitinophagales bacterium]|nr:GNAT family N-acetyltransferase [Chitinophagales bacterium]
MSNKEQYIKKFCQSVPVFHQPFWLDAVAGKNWDVALITKDERLLASMPFVFKKTLAGREIIMPHLTQFLGPYYQLTASTYRSRLNEEMDLISDLLSQIPSNSIFFQRWHFSFQNWLPFYWERYRQTVRYTYILENILDHDILWSQFNEKIRREIKKAANNYIIEESKDVDAFYWLLKKNLLTKGNRIAFSREVLQNLYNGCKSNNAGQLWIAKDSSGKIDAAIFIVWDRTAAYYLIGGKNPENKNTGTMSFLFWHAIKTMSERVSVFDFEGSMIKGVENYFRSFGAKQKPYFEIFKTSSIPASIKFALLKMLK